MAEGSRELSETNKPGDCSMRPAKKVPVSVDGNGASADTCTEVVLGCSLAAGVGVWSGVSMLDASALLLAGLLPCLLPLRIVDEVGFGDGRFGAVDELALVGRRG
jgi:hypothetical protein